MLEWYGQNQGRKKSNNNNNNSHMDTLKIVDQKCFPVKITLTFIGVLLKMLFECLHINNLPLACYSKNLKSVTTFN